MMQLDVLGSSGTAPTAANAASGYLVSSGSTTLWMDAGPGTFMALLRRIDPEAIDALLLSHMHPDHCTDLFALFHELSYVRRVERRVPLIAPDGSTERIRGFIGGAEDHALYATYDIHEPEPGESLVVGDIEISPQAAHHSVPALAYRLESAGATMGYTGDTGPSEMLDEHFAGVDLLLAEASLQDASDRYPFHMTARQAGEMATRAGAGQLIATHVPASLDPAVTEAEARQAYAGPFGLAAPGDVYMIGASDKDG